MPTWLIVAYVLVGLVVFREVARRVAWHRAEDNYSGVPTDADKVDSFFVGAFAGVLWPVAIPGYLLVKLGIKVWHFFEARNMSFWSKPQPIRVPWKGW